MQHAPCAPVVLLAVLALLLPCAAWAAAPGTIHFEDGTTLEFNDITEFPGRNSELPVFFENTWRRVPPEKLASIEIVQYRHGTCDQSYCLKDVVLRVNTKTGFDVTYEYEDSYYVKYLRAELLDKLTGEVVNQLVPFILEKDDKRRLNIRKIVFH